MNKKYYNRQKYYDCQFITLINACIYWDRPFITPYSRQYNKLMKGSGCRYGACIDLSKAYDLLRIKFDPEGFDQITIEVYRPRSVCPTKNPLSLYLPVQYRISKLF